jgi:hypothetical protein
MITFSTKLKTVAATALAATILGAGGLTAAPSAALALPLSSCGDLYAAGTHYKQLGQAYYNAGVYDTAALNFNLAISWYRQARDCYAGNIRGN